MFERAIEQIKVDAFDQHIRCHQRQFVASGIQYSGIITYTFNRRRLPVDKGTGNPIDEPKFT
jgi:hypothetical protein